MSNGAGGNRRLNANHSAAECVGRWFGRAWRALSRAEKRYAEWLIRRGVSHRVAFAAIWMVRLVLLTVAAYISLVIALLVAVAIVLAKGLARGDQSADEDQSEWRYGPMGWGLYDRDGCRLYPFDADDQR